MGVRAFDDNLTWRHLSLKPDPSEFSSIRTRRKNAASRSSLYLYPTLSYVTTSNDDLVSQKWFRGGPPIRANQERGNAEVERFKVNLRLSEI